MAIYRTSIINTTWYPWNDTNDRDLRDIVTTFTLPDNWNPEKNLIAAWAAGGSGGMGDFWQSAADVFQKTSGGGGGSGAFGCVANVALNPGDTLDLLIPAPPRGFSSTSGTNPNFSSTGSLDQINFLRANNLEIVNSNLGVNIILQSGESGTSGWGNTFNEGGRGGLVLASTCPTNSGARIFKPGSDGGSGRGDIGSTLDEARQDYLSGGSGAGAPGPNDFGGPGSTGTESDGTFFLNAVTRGGGAGNYFESGVAIASSSQRAGEQNQIFPDWATPGGTTGTRVRSNGFTPNGSVWGNSALYPYVELTADWEETRPAYIERFNNFGGGFILTNNFSLASTGTIPTTGPGGGGSGSSATAGGNGANLGGGGGGGGAQVMSTLTYPGGQGGASGIFFIWETDDHTNFNFTM